MSATAWGVLVIFVASFSALAILLVGLVRALKDLVASVKRVQERIAPLAERLATETAAAQRSLEDLTSATQTAGGRGRSASNGASRAAIGGDRAHPGPPAG